MKYIETIHNFRGHEGIIYCLTLSPNQPVLASGSRDKTIRIWNTQTGELLNKLTGHTGFVLGVAWSPDGKYLASASADNTIRLWDIINAKCIAEISSHSSYIRSIAWSPDGKYLASASDDKTVQIHLMSGYSTDKSFALVPKQAHKSERILKGHTNRVLGVAWSPNGKTLASASEDRTIRIWDIENTRTHFILEGHTDAVTTVTFSPDNSILASKALDGTTRFWHSDTAQMLAGYKTLSSDRWTSSITFHPKVPLIAILDERDTTISICEVNTAKMLGIVSANSVSYTNAKVILVGESGVGKSGLGLVLSTEKFELTASTHGRHIWTFLRQQVGLRRGAKEIQEILLWDLAGQPGYRLIHQLHLDEVVLALVVIDAHSETNPFASVHYWDRALRQAQRIQGVSALPLKKFLVAARIDRGGLGVSEDRIKTLMNDLGFDGFFQTSAKEGWGITTLRRAIRNAIRWEILPKVSSTELFQRITAFLIATKKVGNNLLVPVETLYETYLNTYNDIKDTPELRDQFDTCIGRVESVGLIKRLSFGNLICLQPELLDSFASALINAVKDEPDGLGSIEEVGVHQGNFRMSKDERLRSKEQEKLLIIAMIEDLLRRELVLREESFLIFPSQSTRERSDLPDPKGKSVIFDFEGPIINIYATLSVRLANSYIFKKDTIWKNAITYKSVAGGLCGMFLNNIGEGRGELILFFDEENHASQETKNNFEEYVHRHLQRHSIPGTLKCRHIVVCQSCGFEVTDQLMEFIKISKINTITCPNPLCAQKITFSYYEEPLMNEVQLDTATIMDHYADRQRDLEANKSILQGKVETNDYDVFFCYNNVDKDFVRSIGKRLKEHGVLPWFDEWEIAPGKLWQDVLEEQIMHIKTAAVFFGKGGSGKWQKFELQALLDQFAQKNCRVIPVILPDFENNQSVPVFLKGITHVDFREKSTDPIERLIWGITDERVML